MFFLIFLSKKMLTFSLLLFSLRRNLVRNPVSFAFYFNALRYLRSATSEVGFYGVLTSFEAYSSM